MLSLYQIQIIQEALFYLRSVPQMNRVFANLPNGINYNVVKGLPGLACYDNDTNEITINEKVFVCGMTSKQKLIFLTTLAHELCHASQKKAGLSFGDLINSSFGETFRVSRMMEIESILLETIVENELLNRKEFEDCWPSDECLFYQSLLEQNRGDIQQTTRCFILSYWKNSIFKVKENTFIQSFKANINEHYHNYAVQAYHQSIAMHKYNHNSTKHTQPLVAIGKYLERMNLRGMLPEMFLQNNFDNIETTNNANDGITILDADGNKYCNYSPTNCEYIDRITYYKDNIPYQIFLQDNCTNERDDVTFVVVNMNMLEKAIKERNLYLVKQIFNKDPHILNRQTIPEGNFPLLMAIQNNYAEAVHFILEKSPNLLLNTINGESIVTELHKLTNKRLCERIQYMYIQQMKEQMFGFCESRKPNNKSK